MPGMDLQSGREEGLGNHIPHFATWLGRKVRIGSKKDIYLATVKSGRRLACHLWGGGGTCVNTSGPTMTQQWVNESVMSIKEDWTS